MPEITLVAAVKDRVRRADGSILASGLQLGQQLETAKEQSANYSDRRGINASDYTIIARRPDGTPREFHRINDF